MMPPKISFGDDLSGHIRDNALAQAAKRVGDTWRRNGAVAQGLRDLGFLPPQVPS
jgi:hypothetical protein